MAEPRLAVQTRGVAQLPPLMLQWLRYKPPCKSGFVAYSGA
jgi:hypothetical protein